MSSPKEASPSLSSSSLSSPSSSPPSSASVLGTAWAGSSMPPATAYSPPSQVSGDHFSVSTRTMRQARAHGAPKDIPLYMPHGQVLEQAEYCLVRPGEDDLIITRPPNPAKTASGWYQEAKTPLGDTRTIQKVPHPIMNNRHLPDQELSPRGAETQEDSGGWRARSRRGATHGPEPAERQKSNLKKLVLSPEQKTNLLDWNDSAPESLHFETGAQFSQKVAQNGREGHVLKPVSPLQFPPGVKEPQSAHRETPERAGTPAEQVPWERPVPVPKSPLRILADAFWRTLEPMFISEGGRKATVKPKSKTLPTSQSHACTRSLSLRNSSSSKDWDPHFPGREALSRASTFFSRGTPTARTDQPLGPSLPNLAFHTQSLPNRGSKTSAFNSPSCSRIEDVPSLMEKVSLQETYPEASRVPKRTISLASSFRLKEKSWESLSQEPRYQNDLWSSPGGNTVPLDNTQPPEKQGWNLGGAHRGCKDHPFLERDADPWHIPVRMQVRGTDSSTSSSSADEELDPQPSLRSKDSKTLRRRRKLEKETKQLVKQEELKRLHKAQAIQRQLEEVEERQRASEVQGVRLEKALRGEADSGTQDEAQLLQEWFKLVLEKNKLMRYESELLIMAQELELEDHQSRLEQKLREKMLKEESQKDENDLNEEQEIFSKMMQVIEQRDKLVDSLEEQRIKEKAEDQHFESFIFSRGCRLSRT
ncbi:PREDICTED: MICAL C-terminal-like protein [Condylura cristata]|uniref:MICAL C-terminal-like protein n=1 Tax=Condylura cristata TaxID=143302 RepID=UPI0003343943|nr:PREDICTED: MICAL C-terminal-like protein [Condylura cristata]